MLRVTAENGAQLERRMDRAEARAKRADERMDKFEERLVATRKLVEAGMKLMMRLNKRVDEIAKSQQLVLKLLKGGSNGHGSALSAGRPGVTASAL